MSAKVLVPVADGCEEIEAITIVDTLRRAGASVTIASCQKNEQLNITGSHDIRFQADCPILACYNQIYHLIVLPGGVSGAKCLKDTKPLIDMLITQKNTRRWYAAICASPAIVLSPNGLLDNVRATCYPSMIDKLDTANARLSELIVIDEKKKVITAQGPGNALAFSLELINILYGNNSFRPIAKQMVADWAL
ncbi:putative cysteine protease YraA [invertebrate metagenome]|uniref:Putative cysteine protease YraA n=1 Tax=invertebrate metagenome TaxID=1711999 RepID=A0A2H9TAZ2_9ZZZZ